jgi:peptidyl-prolyl cis-trans isomerase B (cyclophilin B)
MKGPAGYPGRTRRGPALIAGLAILAFTAARGPAARGPAARVEVAVISTPYGDIVWRFFDREAPEHASYVKALIRRGFYDGTTLHRVIPHFVVQGGDPNSKDQDRGDDGEGEADRRLKAEFSPGLHYRPGTVGMARDADPDSGSCQFFIAIADIPRLDGRYTVFGEVVEGLEVARRIAGLPRDLNDNPLERVAITAHLERRRVPATIRSLEPAAAPGEVLTGPDKPKPYDPGNVRWTAPRLRTDAQAAAGAGGTTPAGPAPGEGGRQRVELAIDTEGAILDLRFPDLIDPARAAAWRERLSAWRFDPATYEGKPRKTRFEIDSDGGRIGPPSGGGAPIEVAPDRLKPPPALILPPGPGRRSPAAPARLRLTIDETGKVTEAAIQTSCGDSDLDSAAIEAARRLTFEPVRVAPGAGGEPRPVAVYVNLEARFATPD